MASVNAVLGLIAGSLAVASVSATKTPTATTPTRIAYAAAAKPNVVHVTGEDFKFDAPAIIPAGPPPAMQHET